MDLSKPFWLFNTYLLSKIEKRLQPDDYSFQGTYVIDRYRDFLIKNMLYIIIFTIFWLNLFKLFELESIE